MEKTLEDLKLEADALGLTYSANIGAAKLSAKIDEWYEKESAENTAKVVTADEVEEKQEEDEVLQPLEETKAQAFTRRATSELEAKQIIKMQEAENLKTVVVKVSCVDKREASTATHAYFSTGNVSMNIPLDVYVEMPKILVYMAEQSKALVHTDSNGETVSKLQKKYVVEYK